MILIKPSQSFPCPHLSISPHVLEYDPICLRPSVIIIKERHNHPRVNPSVNLFNSRINEIANAIVYPCPSTIRFPYL